MSKKATKTVETKIGTSNEVRNITQINTKSQSNMMSNITLKPVTSVPEVKLSPLRSRLKERNSNTIPIQERPHPLTQKSDESKPKKKIVVDVKSPPKVFKSPTWYKSPRLKVVKDEDVLFKQLLLKDPRYTEQDINKILNDHK